MGLNLPNLSDLPSALAKPTSAIEEDTRDFIEKKIPAVDAKRQSIFELGGTVEKALNARS